MIFMLLFWIMFDNNSNLLQTVILIKFRIVIVGKKSSQAYMSKFFVESVEAHPDFSNSTITMNVQTATSMPIIQESSITIGSVNAESVSSQTYSNQTVTFSISAGTSYTSDVYFQVQSQSYLAIVENTYIEYSPDLPCYSSSGSTSITFSLAGYNGGSVPTWLVINAASGTLKVTAPSVTAATDYTVYINSQLSGVTDPVQKHINIQINKWTANNWAKWTATSTTTCAVWNSNFELIKGIWQSQSNQSNNSLNDSKESSIASSTINSINIVTKSSVSTTVGAVVISSIIGISSLASIWIMINQLQIFFLLLFTGVSFPDGVIEVITGSKIFLFPFPSIPFKNLKFQSSLINYFQIDQSNSILERIGVESESTLINIYSFACSFILAVLIHFFIAVVFKVTLCLETSKCCKLLGKWIRFIISKLFYFLTFGYYIRNFIETFQYMLISSISEVKRLEFNTKSKMLSFAISIILILIWLIFAIFSLIMSCRVNKMHDQQRDKFGELFVGLKQSKTARFYTVSWLIKKLIFVSLLLMLASTYLFYVMLTRWLIQISYIVYLVKVRPFEEIRNNFIEVINEIYFTVLLGSLYYLNSKEKWTTTYSNIYVWIIWSNNLLILVIAWGK